MDMNLLGDDDFNLFVSPVSNCSYGYGAPPPLDLSLDLLGPSPLVSDPFDQPPSYDVSMEDCPSTFTAALVDVKPEPEQDFVMSEAKLKVSRKRKTLCKSNPGTDFERLVSTKLNPNPLNNLILLQSHLKKSNKPFPRNRNHVYLKITRQPPQEVRTRTPSENRTFCVGVSCKGPWTAKNITHLNACLMYRDGQDTPRQKILGGKRKVRIESDGSVRFEAMSMCEASTKHGEREFCLRLTPVTNMNKSLDQFSVQTDGFYAFSHMKVLTRRRNVSLRALSCHRGSVRGGDQMHVVGQPFIRGPSLKVMFRSPHGDIEAPNMELYSDSVLFFTSPSYPQLNAVVNQMQIKGGGLTEIKGTVVVTNDGRTMSNGLEFHWILI